MQIGKLDMETWALGSRLSLVGLGKGTLSLPQSLRSCKMEAEWGAHGHLGSAPALPPFTESKYGSWCSLYNKGWAGHVSRQI